MVIWLHAAAHDSIDIIAHYLRYYHDCTDGENVVFTVFTDIQIPGEEWDNVFANNSFNIKVDAEAIQAANLTEEDAWKAMTK